MLRDLDYALKNLDGTEGLVNGQPVRVKDEVIPALQHVAPGQLLGPDQKVERYKLALKAYDGGKQEFTQEELNLIKVCVGFAAAILVVGQIVDWADNDTPTPPGGKKQDNAPQIVEPPPGFPPVPQE